MIRNCGICGEMIAIEYIIKNFHLRHSIIVGELFAWEIVYFV